MPRAHRHFLPGQLWHITHRCHEKAFLLKFARDRRRYLRWLFEAKKRFGLCVLNYVVTSNHIHHLNMVRAGVVRHPQAWPHGGCVLQEPRDAYRVIFSRENEALRRKNTVYWTHNPRNT